MKKHLSLILSIFVIILFIGYYVLNKDEIVQLEEINFISVIAIFLLFTCQILLNGAFLQTIINYYLKADTIDIKEGMFISAFSAVGNFFSFFQGGIGVRGIYLKKKYNLDYSTFFSSVIVNYILLFAVFGSLGLIGLLLSSSSNLLLSLFIFCLSFGGIFVILLWKKLPSWMKFQRLKVFRKIDNSIDEIWAIFKKPKLISKLVAILLVRLSLAAMINFFVFSALNLKVAVHTILIYTCLAGLSIIINLTPGSLGFRESLLFAYKDMMDLNILNIMDAALIERSILLFVLIITYFVTQQISKKQRLKAA